MLRSLSGNRAGRASRAGRAGLAGLAGRASRASRAGRASLVSGAVVPLCHCAVAPFFNTLPIYKLCFELRDFKSIPLAFNSPGKML